VRDEEGCGGHLPARAENGMAIGMVGDFVWNKIAQWRGTSPITDQRIIDFIDGAEWISLWLIVTVTVISIFGLVAIYAERKVSAHMQSRLGPMRVGPKGLLQTLADGIKLLEKEDIIPKAADPVLFIAAPCFVFASAVAMFVVLPFFNYEGTKTIRVVDISPSEVEFRPVEKEGEEAAKPADKPMTALEKRRHEAALKNGDLIRKLDQDEDAKAKLAGSMFPSYEWLLLCRQNPEFSAERLGLDPRIVLREGERAYQQSKDFPEPATAKGKKADKKPEAAVDKRLASYHEAGEKYGANIAPIADVTVPGFHVDRPWLGTPAWASVGLFFIMAISSVSVMGVVLAGWGSNNKWALYGAIREAAQMVSYEIPMGIAALTVVVACQSLNLMDIAQIQETGTILGLGADHHLGILSWNIIKFPLLIPVFLVFYIGVLAHTKRAPFDLPEAESELIAGFMTEYSGMRWSLFFLAEYGEMYALSALTAVLFLGGMAGAIPGLDGTIKDAGPLWWALWGAFNIIWKTMVLVFVMMWLRWTLPRIRLDQVMYLCLKVLLPATIILLLLQTAWSLLIPGV
jgi:NADH-quinone oxidoreductase subunit H